MGNAKDWGGGGGVFENIKVFLKNQKHEANIVEITHLCIMHRAHTSNIKLSKLRQLDGSLFAMSSNHGKMKWFHIQKYFKLVELDDAT